MRPHIAARAELTACPVSRRTALRRLIAVGATLLVPGPRAAAAPERPDVRLAVGGKTTLYYLPLTIAEQLGYFKDEGLRVEISDFPGGAKSLQALMGHSADVVSGAFEHTIVMQTLAQKVQAFVLQGTNPGISLGNRNAESGRLLLAQGPQRHEDRRERTWFQHPDAGQPFAQLRRANAG